jgi:hypothetical protein
MARIRTIKPEFWTSSQVMSVSRSARLLFIGMWNFADDGGNQPANTKTIKAQVFPGDDLAEPEINAMVSELLESGLLESYEVDYRWYWHIPTWRKHQRIDQATYRYPNPSGVIDQNPTRRRSGSTNVQQVFVEQSQNAQQVFGAGKERKGMDRKGEEVITDSDESAVNQASPALPDCPHGKILELYAKHLPELSQPRSWDGQRAKDMRTNWRWILTQTNSKGEPVDEPQAIAFFDRFFAIVAESDFLTGRDGKWPGCNLPWLMKRSNFLKVVEGNYQNRVQK